MLDSITNASDADLLIMANTVIAGLGAPTAFGLTAADVTDLSSTVASLTDTLNAHSLAQAAAKQATVNKNFYRDDLETKLRRVRSVSKAHGTSAGDFASLGIPPSSPTPSTNATVPFAVIEQKERLKHTINWSDASSINSKRRPRGTVGVEIFVKVGDPLPTSEADCTFVALDTVTPYVNSFEPTDGNKVAHYLLRWRMADGSVSGMSETVSATITA